MDDPLEMPIKQLFAAERATLRGGPLTSVSRLDDSLRLIGKFLRVHGVAQGGEVLIKDLLQVRVHIAYNQVRISLDAKPELRGNVGLGPRNFERLQKRLVEFCGQKLHVTHGLPRS